MNSGEDPLPLSALQHLVFCERQCALIHIEQVWVENWLTATGRNMHERVHEGGAESRGDLREARGLRLVSTRLGLVGVADVVEFHRVETGGVPLPGAEGLWRPFPVEHKRGRPKAHRADEVQLCGQAICLEEMLGLPVTEGALFYGKPRRRQEVAFDAALRETTERAAARLRELFESRATPPAAFGPHCESCSLVSYCLPRSAGARRSVAAYLEKAVAG